MTPSEATQLRLALGLGMKQQLHIHTFEHAQYGHVLRGSAYARNQLAGIVRAARSVGLIARRNPSGTWSFTLPGFGFSSASTYLLR